MIWIALIEAAGILRTVPASETVLDAVGLVALGLAAAGTGLETAYSAKFIWKKCAAN